MENHDERGRFTEGNRASQGRRVDRLKKALHEAVSEDDIRDIVDALIVKAKEGDVRAAGLLLDRIFGKPHQSREPQPMEFNDGAGEVVFDDEAPDYQERLAELQAGFGETRA